MAPTTKYSGQGTKLMYIGTVDTSPTTDLSGSSRTISIDESGNEQDVSTRDDYIANATAFISTPPQRTVKLDGIDTTPQSSRTWQSSITVGSSGRVAVYPLGSSPTGLPYEIGNVVCSKKSYDSPHDNGAKYSVEWRVNGAWTSGTT